MLKFIVPTVFLFSYFNAHAVVKAQFFGMQTMLNIIGQDRFGNRDSDPIVLFNMINTPVQHTFLGPAKLVTTGDKKFRFVCAVQGNENKCSVIIDASSATSVNPISKNLTYEVDGTEANNLIAQFFLNESQTLHFVSADQQLTLDAVPNHFRLHFQANGSK